MRTARRSRGQQLTRTPAAPPSIITTANMSRLAVLSCRLQPHIVIIRSISRTSNCLRRYDPRVGLDDDGDYDVHYESYAKPDYNKPVKGSYTEGYSGDAKERARMDGQKNFEGFPLVQKVGLYDYKHTPKPLLRKEFDYPLCEDRLSQRYPGYWIKGKFHYVKEMEPELIVPDLTGFPLKPYVSYRAQELDTPELTAKTLFNLVYADDVYKSFMRGDNVEEEEPVDGMIESAEKARAEAEKTGSDRFVPNSWYGIGVDKFD